MIDRYEQIGRQCEGTPDIAAFDICGNIARQIQSNRLLPEAPLDILVTRNTWSLQGYSATRTDPRLLELQQADSTVKPNVSNLHDLAGRCLRGDSIDAGKRTVLWDVAGNPVLQFLNDDAGTQSRFEYDGLTRPTAAYQKDAGGTERIRERWCYGEDEPDQTAARAGNLLGRCVRHYDTAGRLTFTGYTLSGKPLGETRQLVSDRSQGTDWQGSDETAWSALLETTAYTTGYTYNAFGELTTLTDAVGNRHEHHYNVACQLTSIDIVQKDKSPVTVVGDILYDANGLRLADRFGNGMTNTHSYDPATLRLVSSQTLRPEQEGRDPMLQDLYYDYDPVGNVIATYNYALNDSANENAGMLGESTFFYDACYRLCTATGRENGSNRQSSELPQPITPIIADPTRMNPYERSYRYDRAGNLLEVKHLGAVQYTQAMVASDRSNRCVLQTDTVIQPADVDRQFDLQGNPATLSTGAALTWNRYNQLARVTTVTRTDGNPNDTESYFYDGNCQRVCKESKTLQSTETGSVNTIQTLYLPGLTVRRTLYGGTLNEELHTLSVSGASDQDIRILHWTAGQPAEIGNDQYRYSVNNQIHANLIELDANADILTLEEYYPFGGTAVWSTRNVTEAKYKFIRYSGKERDITGLYYYGFRYYIPWMARWTNPDPAGFSDGLNVYQMVHNDPATYFDPDGHSSASYSASRNGFMMALVLQPAFFVREQASMFPGWQPDHSSTLTPPQNHIEMGDIPARANEDLASALQDVPPDTTHYEEVVANQSNQLPQSAIPPDDWTIPIAKQIGEHIATARTEFFSLYDSHGGATYTEHMDFVSDLYLLFDKVADLTMKQPHRTGTIMSEALGIKGIKNPNDALAFIFSARQNFVFIGEHYLKERSDPASRFNMPDLKSVLGPHWISLDIFPGTDSSNRLRTYTIHGAQVRDTTA